MGSWLLTWTKRCALVFAGLSLLLLLTSFALRRGADPTLFPPNVDRIRIYVVDHGYHAGLILPRKSLADVAVGENLPSLLAATLMFSAFNQVEIGWGEENFYRHVPRADITAMPHVLRAMLYPANRSVLHIVGINGDVSHAFTASDLVALDLSPAGFRHLAKAMDRQFSTPASGEVMPLGPGLYGASAFFAARDRYHLFNTCNHWVGQMLALAGVPYAPVESFLSAGLMMDLRRRAVPKL